MRFVESLSRLSILLCVALISFVQTGNTQASERQDYLAAKYALERNNISTYQAHARRLESYSLKPFLEYEYLRTRLDRTDAQTIRNFIDNNHNAVVARLLRNKWLERLVDRKQWKKFLQAYDDTGDTKLKCHHLRLLISGRGVDSELDKQIETIWLHPKSLPDSCDPVFAAWKQVGLLTDERVWARIELAIEKRQLGIARYLSRTYLPTAEQRWANRWVQAAENPTGVLTNVSYDVNSERAQLILLHGVYRLARGNPTSAYNKWNALTQRHPLSTQVVEQGFGHAGTYAALDRLPAAYDWFPATAVETLTPVMREWRVRAALRNMDWVSALHAVHHMTDGEQQEPNWRYWKARALEQTGKRTEAQNIYSELAAIRNYYGFLAADRLNTGYAMTHQSMPINNAELKTLGNESSIQMAFELFAVGDIEMARRQWRWYLLDADKATLRHATVLAFDAGWHSQAIIYAAKSKFTDDLNIRFPLLYKDDVTQNAQRNSIDPGWIYGVIRQESAFITDAQSGVGALGLMQLMPATAKRVGRELGLNIKSRASMVKTENNIKIGTRYLRSLVKRYNGNQALASAAYNAGERRADRWHPRQGSLDADIWVETIPFNETRNFVKNVLAYATVYNNRLGDKTVRLSSRMPTVRTNSLAQN